MSVACCSCTFEWHLTSNFGCCSIVYDCLEMFGCKTASFLFCNCLNLIIIFHATMYDSGKLGLLWSSDTNKILIAVQRIRGRRRAYHRSERFATRICSRANVRNGGRDLHRARMGGLSTRRAETNKNRFNCNLQRMRLKAISGAFVLF